MTVLMQAINHSVRPGVSAQVLGPFAPLKPPDPSVGHDPAAAGVTGGEPFNAKTLLLLASPHHLEYSVAPNGQFLVGSHPNLPRPVAGYAPHRCSRKTPISGWHGKPALMPAPVTPEGQFLVGSHPNLPRLFALTCFK